MPDDDRPDNDRPADDRRTDTSLQADYFEQIFAQDDDPGSLASSAYEAAKFAPIDQLCLSPQCGFSSTVHGNNIAVQAQRDKLRLGVEVAQEVWG